MTSIDVITTSTSSGANASQAAPVQKSEGIVAKGQADGKKNANAGDTVSISKKAMQEAEVARQTGALKLLGVDTDNIAQLRDQITKVFSDQGMATQFKAGDQNVDLQQLTPEEAQKLVGEDGYFGVEKTSQRLADIAIGAAGGDVSKLDVMKKGLEQGLAGAKKAFGNWLPDISYATYDAAVKKLDAWAANQQTPAAAEPTV
jgi:anti-sigma28 factor (negative regulator of flagellin synthesis)